MFQYGSEDLSFPVQSLNVFLRSYIENSQSMRAGRTWILYRQQIYYRPLEYGSSFYPVGTARYKELLLNCRSPENSTHKNTETVEMRVTFKYLEITQSSTPQTFTKDDNKDSQSGCCTPPLVASVHPRIIQPSICTVSHVSFICILLSNPNASQTHQLEFSVSLHLNPQN